MLGSDDDEVHSNNVPSGKSKDRIKQQSTSYPTPNILNKKKKKRSSKQSTKRLEQDNRYFNNTTNNYMYPPMENEHNHYMYGHLNNQRQ